jgi:hypothetical protein
MQCNWELFELRVAIFFRGTKIKNTGNFTGEVFWEFFNVSVDLLSLGISNFQRIGNYCNFRDVFTELVRLKWIPFGFSKEIISSDRLNFGNLQAGEQNELTYKAAKLYVHRRDQNDLYSEIMGDGVLLEGVKVAFTYISNGNHYVTLSGDSANSINF